MFEHGAQIVKFDLHVHTKSEKTRYTDRKYSNEEYAVRFVQTMQEKDVKIVAITNHNLFNKEEYLAIRKEAEQKGKGLLVLPGVEVSLDYGKGGIHVLVILPGDCAEDEVGNSHCAMERFLSNMYPEKSFDENGNPVKHGTLQDMADVLEEKIKKPYMLIPAHVDNDNGFFRALKPANYNKFINEQWMRKRIVAFQGINESSKAAFLNQMNQVAKGKSYSASLLEPAFIEASDARAINDIGKKYSEIKMGELSFDALFFALSLHRLRMNNEGNRQYSWIKGIQFNSNKCLSNVNVPLNKNLNTLIGVRGSGKSTIIESIRYAFELDAKEDANYKEDLLEELLGSGNEIIVDLVDKAGAEYQIRRTLREFAKVYQNGEYKPGLKPLALWNINYYGQKDLQGMVKDTSHTVGFIDTYIQKELAVLEQQENYIKEELRDLFRNIEQVEQKLNRKKEYEEKLALAEKVIDDFKRNKIADKLKIEADYNKDKVRLDQYKESIVSIEKLISRFGDEIKGLLDLEIDIKTQNKDVFQNIKKASEDYKAMMNTYLENMMNGYKGYVTAFDDNYNVFIQKQDQIKEQIKQVKREIDIKDLSLDDYSKNVGIKEKMTILLKEINNYDLERKRLLKKKDELLNKLQNIWHESFQIRQNKADEINKNQTLVNITVNYKGDKTEFSEMLKGLLTGSRISGSDRERVVNKVNDGIEIMKALSMENNIIRQALTDISYTKFQTYCSNNEYELITSRIPDVITIQYSGKDICNLSLGQRASAMMMLILGLSEMPLIMDQPEDDLDNQVIYGGLVKEIWKQKERRQIVFATHNSNIPVLGDSEQGVVCSIENEKMQVITGSIDTNNLQKAVVDIMEGGKEAFDRRKEVYEKWI